MSIIKPGKLGVANTRPNLKTSRPEPKPRDVWEDFSNGKGSKKKEYQKSAGNRMLPTPSQRKEITLPDDSGFDENSYHPRNDYEILEQKLQISFKDRSLLYKLKEHR